MTNYCVICEKDLDKSQIPYETVCSNCYWKERKHQFKQITKHIENFGKEYASYWGCAIAGEVGEACNLIKKFERDNLDIRESLAEELADIFIYSELIARFFKIDFEQAILDKLEIIKKRRE